MKKTMVSLGLLIAVLVMFGVHPAVSAVKEKYEEKFEKTVNLVKDGKVILGNISGDIEVRTWTKAQVQIDALKISQADTLDKAKENAAEVKIVITEENSSLRIQTEYPEKSKKNVNVSIQYTLTIPADASLNANTVSGDVTCEDIGGDLKAKTISGDVSVSGAKNGANCTSTSGDVGANNVIGDVKLHTVSGNVTAEKIQGSVSADTVSGDVKMSDITGADEIEGTTMSGEASYEGDLSSGGYYHLQSHSGRVEFIVPANAAFDLEARTFSGVINSDFDITVRGKIEKKSLSGSVNGGGAEVELKAFSGNVYLKKK